MVSFFLPIRFPGLNEYSDAERTHRMVAAKMKKEYTNLVQEFCTLTRVQKFKGQVTLSFEWHEANNRRDPDNVVFAKKFILDGMVNAGVLVNDTQKYILGWDENWVVDPKNVGVMVSVVEYD